MDALSRRVGNLGESATLFLASRAASLRAQGADVVDLTAGEPDFPTPEHVRAAAVRAIEEGFTRYTAVAGIPELRAAIAARASAEWAFAVDPAETIVTCGAKHALFNAIQVLCDEGGTIVAPAPYWVSYPAMARTVGAEFIPVPCGARDGWVPDPTAVERALDARTRLLIVNSPNNPTGAVWPADVVRAVGEIARRYDIYVLVDEIYDRLVYDVEFVPWLRACPETRDRTIVVNGVSKSYAMTGWRIGWAVGPRALIAAMARLQSHSTSNPASISQRAALAALTGDQGPVEEMRRAFDERRRALLRRVASADGLRVVPPHGAFYAMIDVSSCLGARAETRAITDATAFAEALLDEASVAVVPGDAFGAPGTVRVSYAAPVAAVEEGLRRLSAFVASLERGPRKSRRRPAGRSARRPR